MTVFTRTWNAAYMAAPANGDNASEGAARIREIRTDVKERLEVDHSWAGDVDDGMHKQVTFVDPLAAKPTQANDETYVYSKDVGGTAELFFEDESGNEIQLTSAGVLASKYNTIPQGTVMVFYQASVPTGWTTAGSLTDHALRVVADGSGGVTGGTVNFSTLFGSGKTTDSTTLSAAQSGLPEHTHTNDDNAYAANAVQAGSNYYAVNKTFTATAGVVGGAQAASSGHTHPMANLDVKYADIVCGSYD